MHRNIFPNHQACRSEVIAAVWAHKKKKNRKWNVNSKCNTFLIYALHLLRQLPSCSWKKNDLFISQIHYFSSLEEEKCLHYIFPLSTSSKNMFLPFFADTFIYLFIHNWFLGTYYVLVAHENIKANQVFLALKHLSVSQGKLVMWTNQSNKTL